MTKSTALNLTQDIGFKAITFTSADSANTVRDSIVADVDGEVVKCIQATNDDTSNAEVIDVFIKDGGTSYRLGAFSVPANSGFNGTAPAVDVLSSAIFAGLPLDALSKRILPLKGGLTLQFSNQSTIASGKIVTITVISEQF